MRFQRSKPRRKIMFSHGDTVETVEGTSGDFLCKIVYFRPKMSENDYLFHQNGANISESWYKYWKPPNCEKYGRKLDFGPKNGRRYAKNKKKEICQ